MDTNMDTKPNRTPMQRMDKKFNSLILLVPGAGLEPARGHTPRDFKSLASTRSATQALSITGDRSRHYTKVAKSLQSAVATP